MPRSRGKTVLYGIALGLAAFLVHGTQVTSDGTAVASAAGNTVEPGVTPSPSPAEPRVWPSDDEVDCAVVACVALTFDDGPSPSTPGLLDVLEVANVHATFFVVGRDVAARPGDVTRATAQGNEIGNHTWSHADLTKLSAEAATAELTRTADAVEAATGLRPTLVRPPYGDYNPSVDALVGVPEIMWSIDPRDWEARDSAVIAQRVLDAAKPGAIVIMHDSQPTTVAAIPAILDGLLAKGIHPVTVSRLLAGKVMQAGVAYSHR